MGHHQFIALTIVCLFLATPAFAGPKKITLTIHSTPEGATVLANDARTPMGQTPLNLDYPMDGSSNCQIRQGLAVVWVSGARAEISTLALCPSTGKRQQYTFTRPIEAPNAAIDEALALQRQQLGVMQQMADWQAYAAIMANIRKPVYCNSIRIGWQTFTNCY